MKIIFKWFLAIFSMFVLAFFAYQVAIYPVEFNIIYLVIVAFITIFYIISIFKEFTDC